MSKELCEKHQMEEDIQTGYFGVRPYYPVGTLQCLICNPPVKISRSRRKYLWKMRRNLQSRRSKTRVSPVLDVYLCEKISRITKILNSKSEQRFIAI